MRERLEVSVVVVLLCLAIWVGQAVWFGDARCLVFHCDPRLE